MDIVLTIKASRNKNPIIFATAVAIWKNIFSLPSTVPAARKHAAIAETAS
jgi:hypothetical protein